MTFNPIKKYFSSIRISKKIFFVVFVIGIFISVTFFQINPKVSAEKSFFQNIFSFVDNVATAFLAGGSPQTNYQGKLTDNSGIAVSNGSYNVVFNLYATSTGGSPIWTETHCKSPDSGITCDGTGTDKRISITSGVFSVLLGSINSLSGVDFNQVLYLGVEIGGTSTAPSGGDWDGEMSPRKRIGVVPSAFVAKSLNGVSDTQFIRNDTSNVMSSGSTTLTLTQNGDGNILDLYASTTKVFTVLANGKVGIGTSTPSTTLDVNGTINSSGYYLNGVPFTGGDSLWISTTSPYTYIYHVGSVAEGYESVASGVNSHAEGNTTIASGTSSHAEGEYTIASGPTSHAEGNSSIASANNSHGEGEGSIASGSASHAEGSGTTASGNYSHSEGINTVVSGTASHTEGNGSFGIGDYSHAEGDTSVASGTASHAEGYQTIASGYGSHAEGSNSQALGEYSHAENTAVAVESHSHAEGDYAHAFGYASHAEGNASQAIGFVAHTEGNSTIANGDISHAEGDTTIASGTASHAEGYQTIASGYGSHAEGQYGLASGDYSHVQGYGSTASGLVSFAAGTYAQASHDYATVLSDEFGASSTAIDQLVASFQGGILLNPNGGNVGVNNANPFYNLDVNGIVNASSYYLNGSPFTGAILNISAVTSDASITNSNDLVLADATGGNITLSLPAAASALSKIFTVKKTDSWANTVTVQGVSTEEITAGGATLLSHYKMNDNAGNTTVVDSKGGNDGTAQQNTSDMTTSGKINTALSFNGSSDFIQVPYNSVFDFASDGTFSFWVNLNSMTGDYQTVLSKRAGGSNYEFGVDPTGIPYAYSDISGVATFGSAITTGSWFQFTYVVNNTAGTVDFYLNGSFVATQTWSLGTVNGADLAIGHPLTGGQWLNGTVDDIRLYSGKLTPSDISVLYSNGLGTEEENAMIAHYKMNDNLGTTNVIDSKGGNDGTAQQNTEDISTSGQISGTLSFNGSSDSIDLSAVPYISGAFTFATWINFDALNEPSAILMKGDDGSERSIQIFYSSGSLNVQLSGDGSGGNIYSFYTPFTTTGEWVHLAIAWDGTPNAGGKIYINGADVGTESAFAFTGTTLFNSPQPLTLGAKSNGGWNSDALFDDVRIYNTALTESNIDDIYNSGSGTESPLITDTQPSTGTPGSNELINGQSSIILTTANSSAGFISNGTSWETLHAAPWDISNPAYIFHRGSVAEGVDTVASGTNSHAEGNHTIAGMEYAHAEGDGAYAGDTSHAEGQATIAEFFSHAEGGYSFAYDFSHAEGQSVAVGNDAHAEGNYTSAATNGAHAEGFGTVAGQQQYNFTVDSPTTIRIGLNLTSTGLNYNFNRVDFFALSGGSNNTLFAAERAGSNVRLDGSDTLVDIDSALDDRTNGYLIGIDDTFDIHGPHAEGNYTLALDTGSHAEGSQSQALEFATHAEGDSTIAIGEASHSEGIFTIASGTASHAEGYDAIASGDYGSHAEGEHTVANGSASHAEGDTTTANGQTSHSEGSATVALGDTSHAEGDTTQTYGYASHAEGEYTIAFGDYSHAEGYSSTASGNQAHAEGAGTQAIGYESHTEGYLTIALQDSSHAEGVNTWALVNAAHTEGQYTIALDNAHAEGVDSRAYGADSHAEGSGSVTGAHPHGFSVSGTTVTVNGEDLRDYLALASNYLYFYGLEGGSNNTLFAVQGGVHDVDFNISGNTTFELDSEYLDDRTNGTLVDFSNGIYAHAEGDHTQAFKTASHAEGSYTQALGDYSHAEGQFSIASGFEAHAQGDTAIASGTVSFAAGTDAQALHDYSTVFSDHDGASSAANNQFVASFQGGILLNPNGGNVGVNNANPFYNLDVNGIVNATAYYLNGSPLSSFWNAHSADEVAHYPMNDNAGDTIVEDVSSSSNNGTANFNTEDKTVSGNTNTNTALAFNGSSDYISASDANLPSGNSPFSISNWIKSSTYAGGDFNTITVWGTDVAGQIVRWGIRGGGNLSFDSSGGGALDGTTNILDDNWHLTTLVFDGTNIRIYLDGNLEATGDFSSADVVLPGTFYIGAEAASTRYIEGDIDDLRIYKGALTSTDITSLYNSGVGTEDEIAIEATDPSIIFHVGSVAEGSDTTLATGLGSHAEGLGSLAAGNYSHAEGTDGIALGNSSHAEGGSSLAVGYSSHVENNAYSIGDFSHGEGTNSEPWGQYSHTEGNSSKATSDNSHAEGYQTLAGQTIYKVDSYVINEDSSMTITVNGADLTHYNFSNPIFYDYSEDHAPLSFSSDYISNITYGDASTTFTVGASIDLTVFDLSNLYFVGTQGGLNAHAEGEDTVASGEDSHAEGWGARALGRASHAQGSSYAVGYFSNAINNSYAIGGYSSGENDNAEPWGGASHAEGSITRATSDYSHAEGYDTQAGIGLFQVIDYTTPTVKVSGDMTGYDFSTAVFYDYSDSHPAITATDIGARTYDPDNNWTTFNVNDVDLSSFDLGYTYFALTKNGMYSHAEGYQSIASGPNSHAEGYQSIASGPNSHAEGEHANAVGVVSHAEGNYSGTFGANSHAENGTVAWGNSSHSENAGYAYAATSHAEGYSITGQYNEKGGTITGTTITIPSEDLRNYNFAGLRLMTENWDGKDVVFDITETAVEYTGSESIVTISSTIPALPDGTSVYIVGTTQGQYSHAEGYAANSFGDYSHAEGNATYAIGQSSHAEGDSTNALGVNAHAEGNYTYSYGLASHAEGQGGGFGDFSHGENSGLAFGKYSHAEGGAVAGQQEIYAIASGTELTVIGLDVTGVNFNNAKIFTENFDGKDFVVDRTVTGVSLVGGDTVITIDSALPIADGSPVYILGTEVGQYAHAEGRYGTFATGDASHAEGYSAMAIGTSSHAEGHDTLASGEASHAEGNGISYGQYSHSEGLDTEAIGEKTHAEGGGHDGISYAIGPSSHVEGSRTITGPVPQSITISGTTVTVSGDITSLISDGNNLFFFDLTGGSDTLYSGYRIISDLAYADGNTTFTIDSELGDQTYGKLITSFGGDSAHAEGDFTIASGNTSHAQGYHTVASGSVSFAAGYEAQANHDYSIVFSDEFGAESGNPDEMTVSFANGFVVASGTPLILASFGAGDLTTDINGQVMDSSDERLKNIQGFYDKGLADIMKIDPIQYKWKESTGYEASSTYTGFSAQNVQLAIPEAVGKNGKGFLTLSERPIVAAAVNSLKQIGSFLGTIEKGVAHIKNLVVGSAEHPTGITMYDEDTGAPYCLKIKNGSITNIPGVCPVIGDTASVIDAYINDHATSTVSTSTHATSSDEIVLAPIEIVDSINSPQATSTEHRQNENHENNASSTDQSDHSDNSNNNSSSTNQSDNSNNNSSSTNSSDNSNSHFDRSEVTSSEENIIEASSTDNSSTSTEEIISTPSENLIATTTEDHSEIHREEIISSSSTNSQSESSHNSDENVNISSSSNANSTHEELNKTEETKETQSTSSSKGSGKGKGQSATVFEAIPKLATYIYTFIFKVGKHGTALVISILKSLISWW